jgi:hypothetical protein
MIFKLTDGSGSVTIKDWYADSRNQVDEVEFADGKKWAAADLNASVFTGHTDGDDVIGKVGNFSGKDLLDGGAGNDQLYSGDNNDVLVGGTDNDYLEGGQGSDVYIYNRGDGDDTINNYSYYGNSETDVLKFGAGINAWDMETSRDENDLNLSLKDGSGGVKVQNWYSNDSRYKLNEVSFSDGSTWKASDGQAIEAYFQEQAELAMQNMAMSAQASAMSGDEVSHSEVEASDSEMAAAASLLMEESADLFNMEEQLFEETNASEDLTTAELNATSSFEDEQAVVDVAMASLQLEEENAMICTAESTDTTAGESILAPPASIQRRIQSKSLLLRRYNEKRKQSVIT